MSFFNAAENAIMLLLFNATAWANLADNASSSPETDIAVSLHTSDPGETGTLATNECSYTSYARQDVARSDSGWTVSANSVSPVAEIAFPAATGGSETATHFSTGKTGGGSAAGYMKGTITPNIPVSTPVQPKLSTSTVLTID